MIIEFKVKNFYSIRDQQVLSLVASTGTELPNNVFSSDHLNLLPSLVLYGANASGKSNLLSALLFLRLFVLNSAKDSQVGEKINIQSFYFDKESQKAPSEFEVTFILEGVRYQYGFIVDENRVYEEWLFAYPTNRGQQWFSRVYNPKNKEKYSWKFSNFFKHNKEIIKLTRDNVLFLSNAVKLNNQQLIPIFNWFKTGLILIDPSRRRGLSYAKSIEYIKTKEGKKRILKFMKAADPSIMDIILDVVKDDGNLPDVFSAAPKEVQDFFKKHLVSQDGHKIRFIHSGNIPIDLANESDGTVRLLGFAGHWFDALDNGRVLIVDELNNSLHSLMVKFLINLICDRDVNKRNAQLIFTTHDTSLLDNEIFRRDQVWFVEKDKNNSTQIYPLLDFSPRKNEAVGRGYLQGRYGALPYIGEWMF